MRQHPEIWAKLDALSDRELAFTWKRLEDETVDADPVFDSARRTRIQPQSALETLLVYAGHRFLTRILAKSSRPIIL